MSQTLSEQEIINLYLKEGDIIDGGLFVFSCRYGGVYSFCHRFFLCETFEGWFNSDDISYMDAKRMIDDPILRSCLLIGEGSDLTESLTDLGRNIRNTFEIQSDAKFPNSKFMIKSDLPSSLSIIEFENVFYDARKETASKEPLDVLVKFKELLKGI